MAKKRNTELEKLYLVACARYAANKPNGTRTNRYEEALWAAVNARVIALRDALYACGYTVEMVEAMSAVAEKAFYSNEQDVDATAEYLEQHVAQGCQLGFWCIYHAA